MIIILCFGLIITNFIIHSDSASDLHNLAANNWGYKEGYSFKGPSQWKELPNATCGGQRQSPIDIAPRYTIYWKDLKVPSIDRINSINDSITIEKHFSSVYLNFNHNNWKITFGKIGCLKPLTMHWHWGSNNHIGSEHRFQGTQFSMEGHLVSYDCDLYSSPEQAATSPNGLHVIGFLYRTGLENPAMNMVIKAINPKKNLKEFSINIKEIPPRNFLPRELMNYYRYEGSLTTPPCTENVIWTVLRSVQDISEEQLSFFRSLFFGSPEIGNLVNNFRPVVPVEKSTDYLLRVVYASFNDSLKLVNNIALSAFLLLFTSLLNKYLWK